MVDFATLLGGVVGPARAADARRVSIANPAQVWLDRVAACGKLAVVGVRIGVLEDLRALHGYVLEPVLRSGGEVLVESADRLTRLAPERFIDPGFEYAYTLERALHTAMLLFKGVPARGAGRLLPGAAVSLDCEQRAAVEAHDGVVQVIAPAGSGKTTVLVERGRELIRRGTSPERLLCTTFNRDAAVELKQRLSLAGVGVVQARTFHSLGSRLLREEGLGRRDIRGQLSLSQWRRLCAMARQQEGTWIDPADARAAVSRIKLGLLATPAEYRGQAGDDPNGVALARIYELYEQQLADDDVLDFDDLIVLAVRALREDEALRQRWQERFDHVLVDEYQDIEPAQELLVRILAAPQDGLFCVGDEDQTLYGWRRASVRRMIELDLAYPGLQRVSLAHNYRCPPDVVHASRQLIEHNRVRFPKPIHPRPDRPTDGQPTVRVSEHGDQPQAAAVLARAIAGRVRGDVVVLARTTNLLRTVALACAELGVAISAPEQVFESSGARGVLETYLRLCAEPRQARADDVGLVCRVPSRGLPIESEKLVASRLRAGLSFTDSLADLPASASQRAKLDDAGPILDALVATRDARRFIRHLRSAGGLDRHFVDHERTFEGTEHIELEVLDQSEREASGKTVQEYSTLLHARTERLHEVRDDTNGLELATIHRAKGRQWPEVHLFGGDERQLPHQRSLEVDPAQQAAGEGLEAERRLAYVAFTRAQRQLVIYTSGSHPSRFLAESGLRAPDDDGPDTRRPLPTRPSRHGSDRSTGPRPAATPEGQAPPVTVTGPAGPVIAKAQHVGLAYALRTAPSRRAALEAAAIAIARRLVGPATTSSRMTVTDLLQAIETLDDSERQAVLHGAVILDPSTLLARLTATTRHGLAQALRRLAMTST